MAHPITVLTDLRQGAETIDWWKKKKKKKRRAKRPSNQPFFFLPLPPIMCFINKP